MTRMRPACRTPPLSRLYDDRRQQSSYLKGSAAARDAQDLHWGSRTETQTVLRVTLLEPLNIIGKCALARTLAPPTNIPSDSPKERRLWTDPPRWNSTDLPLLLKALPTYTRMKIEVMIAMEGTLNIPSKTYHRPCIGDSIKGWVTLDCYCIHV